MCHHIINVRACGCVRACVCNLNICVLLIIQFLRNSYISRAFSNEDNKTLEDVELLGT